MTNPAGPPRAEPGIAGATRGSSEDRAALADQLARVSDAAAEQIGGYDDVWLNLAGDPVRLRFAGPALAELLLPALSHLEIEPREEAALTVRVWDSEATSSSPPVPAWGPADYLEYGVIRGFFGEGFFTVYDWGTRALNVVDAERRRAFFWIPSAENIGLPERGAPLRTLLNLWISGTDTQLVHGAAVGRPDGCVLLVGSSGAGKSSTALACLGSGLGHIGEDYCVLASGEPPRVASLYSSGKVEPAVLERLPHLRDLVSAKPDRTYHKALLDIQAKLPGAILRDAPLRAVAIPRITGKRETTASPCTAGAALTAVAPNTILQLPGNGRPAMELLSSVVQAVPCHHLDVGADPSLIPAAIERMLDGR